MITIIIIIFLILILSFFALGFLYNDLFLYGAAVLCIIFGLFLFGDGIELTKAATTISSTRLDHGINVTTAIETVSYEKFDATITNAIALIFVLVGIGFVYFEKNGRNTGKDQEGLTGKWL